MMHENPITFFFIFPTWIWLISSLLLLPPPSPALRAQTVTKRGGRTGRERPALRHICALQPLPPPTPASPSPPNSHRFPNYFALLWRGVTCQRPTRSNAISFSRLWSLPASFISLTLPTQPHWPPFPQFNCPQLILPTPLRFKGWDWQWLESEYIFKELIHQRLTSGRIQLINSERCVVKKIK